MFTGGGQFWTVSGSSPSLYIATLTSVILSLVRLDFSGFSLFVSRFLILEAVLSLLFVRVDGEVLLPQLPAEWSRICCPSRGLDLTLGSGVWVFE